MKKQTTQFRNGALGSLLDIYQVTLMNFVEEVEQINDDLYSKILDPDTEDKDCRSIKSICDHVIDSGFYYANLLRGALEIEKQDSLVNIESPDQIHDAAIQLLTYTDETFEKKWMELENNLQDHFFTTPKGKKFDFEKLLQHAVVHILRHHRQVHKLTSLIN